MSNDYASSSSKPIGRRGRRRSPISAELEPDHDHPDPYQEAMDLAAEDALARDLEEREAGSNVVETVVPKMLSFPGEIPVVSVGHVAVARLDVRLTARQQTALRRLFDGLQATGATVHGGSRGNVDMQVTNQGDAARWLLDRLADAMDIQPGEFLTRRV